MKQRLTLILGLLKAKSTEGLTGSISDFQPTSSRTFELKTSLPGKLFLSYEIGGDDELLRIEIVHGFGDLDLSRTSDSTQFLIEMLEQNVPSFRGSSACLGLKRESDRLIVCLSSSHQFLATMTDRDIAESLSIAIFDLKMGGQLFTFPDPVVMWE